jgi:hypothetical protein
MVTNTKIDGAKLELAEQAAFLNSVLESSTEYSIVRI